VNHFLRIWDFYSSKRPDYLIANSKETQLRIKRFYHRDSVIIYPPVNIPQNLQVTSYKLHNYYLTVSRLTKAKHIDVLIKAANKLKLNLKIIGTGRDENYLKSIAGKTVEFLGNLDDHDLITILKNAKAFLFASRDEEFGIAPVEAMGYGVPVIAYNSGGVPEYVKDGVNGFLFNQLSAESLIEKIKKFETLDKEKILKMKKEARKKAEEFTFDRFKKNLLLFFKEKNILFSIGN
jgi:glycosyltransferase involved in cell wall biosynthesis